MLYNNKDEDFFKQFDKKEIQTAERILAQYNELLKERLNDLEGDL